MFANLIWKKSKKKRIKVLFHLLNCEYYTRTFVIAKRIQDTPLIRPLILKLNQCYNGTVLL